MSSGVKGLIAGVAVLALLGGGVAAMKLTEPKNDSSGESSVSSETEEKAIYSGNADDIKSIEVTNDNGGFTIKRTAAASGDTGSTFAVEGLENIKTDDSVLELLCRYRRVVFDRTVWRKGNPGGYIQKEA